VIPVAVSFDVAGDVAPVVVFVIVADNWIFWPDPSALTEGVTAIVIGNEV
jgi:hypothetical protein